MTTPKKEARLRGTRQQPPPSKAEIVGRNAIPLSGKHKRFLAKARRFVSDALDCLDEIDNNVVRGEIPHLYSNAASLRFVLCRCKKLHRAAAAFHVHTRAEAYR